MLVTCPECQKQISSFAVSCPGCGYPMNITTLSDVDRSVSRSRKTSYRRLPNGFGSIRKLSGKRRRKYGAYPAIKEYYDNGTAVLPRAIGYYETYNEAYSALMDYNKNPYDIDKRGLTFASVYQLFMDFKFNGKKQYSDSSRRILVAAYKHCSALYDKPFASIRTHEFQKVVDSCELKTATVEAIILLIKQMSVYAIQNDIIDKNYAQYVKLNRENDDESGVPFTDEEISLLWANSEDDVIKIALILIYSGWRIQEFMKCTYDLENHIMTGGLKTKQGKNRTVPIHDDIYDFCVAIQGHSYSKSNYLKSFHAALERLGIGNSSTGAVHTPHDCRHTFSWLCDRYKVDDLCKRMIMGHSLGKDVETSVYGHRTVDELKSEINKIETGR